MKRQINSQRLPGICGGAPRCECLAFLSIGLACLFVIGSAVFNSARFAIAEEGIADTLSAPYTVAQDPPALVESTNIAARLKDATNSPS